MIIKPSGNSDGEGRYRLRVAQGNGRSSAEGRQSSARHGAVGPLLLAPHRTQTQGRDHLGHSVCTAPLWPF